MADGRWQLVEPGAGDFLALQLLQALKGARCGLRMLDWPSPWLTDACAEIHQASAQAKQYGGQAGGGEGQGFGAGHGNVLEITSSLMGLDDSPVTVR
ncbi:aminoglycoside phosphotransferase [Pseudomonas sp. St290]|nr:aminoglycoside phosphotransferase [Pseudomonas sp. St290]